MENKRRLIDANAANVEHISCYYGNSCYTEDVQEWLDEQPTIDAVEVVYAHWVWNPNGNDWGIGAWCCSKCGGKNDALPWDNKLNPYAFACSHFCPVCGAHMDGDGNV